ncbi:J domain-containing protein [Parvibaculum sp.]|uniref:J domain-containing protein n=1 Tax=Parvibaculum sp. TaxID=2024848 RepID=UPI0025E53129|nr:J domain-containing protein [Parvibaculum sp.]
MRNPYEVLGVGPGASNADIKTAYRRLAKELHPDTRGGSDAVHARFQEVTAAYNQLKDEASRRRFEAERLNEAAQRRRQPAFEETASPSVAAQDAQDDVFSELFEGIKNAGKRVFRARGEDRNYRLSVSFLEAANGARKRVKLADGRTVELAVPPGTTDGRKIRMRGQGNEGHGGAAPGDAIVTVDVAAHPYFLREGADIHLTLPVTLSEAVLGAKVEVPTIAGPVTLTIPAGSNSGTRLRLRGKGVPEEGATTRGDQYVTLTLTLPDVSDPLLKDFAASWAPGLKHDPRKGFWEN